MPLSNVAVLYNYRHDKASERPAAVRIFRTNLTLQLQASLPNAGGMGEHQVSQEC
jgi:hypothetical protein